MQIEVTDDKKDVVVWLTRAEKEDPAVQARLKEIYAEYKVKKYTVAVFTSGEQDLYQNTLSLLLYNRRREAELAARRAKEAASAPKPSLREQLSNAPKCPARPKVQRIREMER